MGADKIDDKGNKHSGATGQFIEKDKTESKTESAKIPNDLADEKERERFKDVMSGKDYRKMSTEELREKAKEKTYSLPIAWGESKDKISKLNAITQAYRDKLESIGSMSDNKLDQMVRNLGEINAVAAKGDRVSGNGWRADYLRDVDSIIYDLKSDALADLAAEFKARGREVAYNNGVLYFRLNDGVQVSFHTKYSGDFQKLYGDSKYEWDRVKNAFAYSAEDYKSIREEINKTDKERERAYKALIDKREQGNQEFNEFYKSLIEKAKQNPEPLKQEIIKEIQRFNQYKVTDERVNSRLKEITSASAERVSEVPKELSRAYDDGYLHTREWYTKRAMKQVPNADQYYEFTDPRSIRTKEIERNWAKPKRKIIL